VGGAQAQLMNLVARLIFALLMIVLAGFCALGFTVTFDNNVAFTMNPPSVQWMWRAIYAFAFFIALGTAVALLRPNRR
jgi:hypothetical protein